MRDGENGSLNECDNPATSSHFLSMLRLRESDNESEYRNAVEVGDRQ